MPTVVIIHAADDTLPARALAEKLRQAKLAVVLEKQGEDLREAAKSAQAAVALWSPRSAADAAMLDDVAFVRAKSKLVHALMQNTQLPDAFRADKAANLTGWRGEDDFPGWRELAKLVTERAGVAPLPPPAARADSGFFQPGRVDPTNVANAGGAAAQTAPRRAANSPPQRQAPPLPRTVAPPPRAPAPRTVPPSRDYAPEPEREKKGGGAMMAIIALLVLGLGGGAGYFWWSQQQNAHAASAAWETIDRNDPAALRAFLASQSGPMRQQAQTALSELEERSYEAASDTDTVEALQGFLRDFPDSQHALAARGRIAELQANAANGAPAAATTTATATTNAAATNPDLVPPGATATTTTTTATPAPATSGGPAPLTPPGAAQAPSQEPQTTTP